MAIYGIGCEILSGFCPLNENIKDEDVITKIHGGASAVGFMTLLIVPLLLAILQFQFSEIVMGVISLLLFIVAFVFFAFSLWEKKISLQKPF